MKMYFPIEKPFFEIMKHCFELNVLSSFNSLLMSLRTEMFCLYCLYINNLSAILSASENWNYFKEYKSLSEEMGHYQHIEE